jgi:hypothetical protein
LGLGFVLFQAIPDTWNAVAGLFEP